MMIQVLYSDDELIVIDKPAGLASQPGERVGASVISVVERDLGFTPFPVHRLDRETAGCMMLARSSRAAARWSELLSGREVRKLYRAICVGKPALGAGTYDDALESDGIRKTALTKYRVLKLLAPSGGLGGEFSLVEFEIGTGRMHQIRRHCAMHGHPILGDDRHGDFPINKKMKKDYRMKQLMLWAWRLELPGAGAIESSVPPHFAEFFRLCGEE
jgi:23S rRNA pseudouridine955/2504/2580 synthase